MLNGVFYIFVKGRFLASQQDLTIALSVGNNYNHVLKFDIF